MEASISWAATREVSIDDILRTANWSSWYTVLQHGYSPSGPGTILQSTQDFTLLYCSLHVQFDAQGLTGFERTIS